MSFQGPASRAVRTGEGRSCEAAAATVQLLTPALYSHLSSVRQATFRQFQGPPATFRRSAGKRTGRACCPSKREDREDAPHLRESSASHSCADSGLNDF